MKKRSPDTCRIIKISRDALFEFIYESMLDRSAKLLDATDDTLLQFDIDWETGSLIAVARDEICDLKEIDTQKLLKHMDDTARSLFDDQSPYLTLTAEEVRALEKA